MSEQANTTMKTIKIPGPDHPITIEHNRKRVVVLIGGTVLADSRDALVLREAGYPAVQYIPRQDVDMTLLERSVQTTYCPCKGDCAYFSIPSGGERAINAVWTYEAPYDAVASIRNHLAFYPERVRQFDRTPEDHEPRGTED
jgi:uncharacterized protein (DUF427 family)